MNLSYEKKQLKFTKNVSLKMILCSILIITIFFFPSNYNNKIHTKKKKKRRLVIWWGQSLHFSIIFFLQLYIYFFLCFFHLFFFHFFFSNPTNSMFPLFFTFISRGRFFRKRNLKRRRRVTDSLIYVTCLKINK